MADGRLFDASSVIELLVGESGEDVSVEALFGEHILDLTVYEAGNALWKLAVAQDELTDDALHDSIALLASVKQEMTVETAIGPGFADVLQVAQDGGLTVYDSAYLLIARNESLTLITEDSALRNAAEQPVSVGRVVDLAE